MTIGTRRQFVALAALLAVAVAFAVLRSRGTGVDGTGTTGAAGGPQAARAEGPVEDLRLDSLDRVAAPDPETRRNVFRFESRQPPVARSAPREFAPDAADTVSPGPVTPAPPPPIPLRYIGYVDQPGDTPRVAVLSDGRGNVFNGKEGDIIEGRYRVLRIGTDSADLVYVDGRGRQTIRLSGQ